MKLNVAAHDQLASAYGTLTGVVRLLTSDDQRRLDGAFVESSGVSLAVLMEQAGTAVASEALRRCESREGGVVLCLAGGGQNGGDVWVAARQLHAEGVRVVVTDLAFGQTLPPEASANREACRRLGIPIETERDRLPSDVSLVIDGIFGSGFRAGRGLPDAFLPYFDLVRSLKASGAFVVAVDLASGVDATDGAVAEGAAAADLSVSFVRPKLGQITWPGRSLHGEIVSPALSMPAGWIAATLAADGVYALTDAAFATCLDPIAEDAHKGTRGRALLVGGSVGMPGAAVLAVRAASAAGSGYQTLVTADEVRGLLADAVPHALLPKRNGRDLGDFFAGQDAVAFGPGLGREQACCSDLECVLGHDGRILIDADGLWHLSRLDGWKARLAARHVPAVLTPHAGEFLRLSGEAEIGGRVEAARSLAVSTRSIVVLKGPATVIALPDRNVLIATTGNAGLAKGGSGDVLTGLLTGFLAGSLSLVEAVAAGVHLHGLAADLAAAAKGMRAVVPEDLLDYLPAALAQIGWA